MFEQTFQSVKLICFSPTHGTRNLLEAITFGMSPQPTGLIDLTLPTSTPTKNREVVADLVLIGVPVYAGRVPLVAVERLQKLSAKGVPAVLVAVYGNRGYGDALLELNDIAVKCGFKPVAAGAFIAEHSFSTAEYPIATARPDAADLLKAKQFGAEVAKRLTAGKITAIKVPGNFPYKEGMGSQGISPETDKSICIDCKKCVYVCPTHAISEEDVTITDVSKCILCNACIKVCPVAARQGKHPFFATLANKLSTNCQARLEPEYFL